MTTRTLHPEGHRRPWQVLAWVAVVALALAGVFMAYTDPHLVVDLANRLWACF